MLIAPLPRPPLVTYCAIAKADVRTPYELRREIAAIVKRIHRRSIAGKLAPEPAVPSLRCLLGHLAVDIAHWLPNMPRGSEDRKRGSARVNNADDVAG